MAIRLIRLLVTCPTCGVQNRRRFNVSDIADALHESKPVRLYAGCHDAVWYASDSEVQAIRDHMGNVMGSESSDQARQ